MVSQLIVNSLKESIGLEVVFWLNNNFRFEGKILGADDECLKYYDSKRQCVKFVNFSEIKEAELK